MSATGPTAYDRYLERRRYLASRRHRTMPAEPRPYTPRLRDDQVAALRVLKRIEGKPMTKLVQEALDRYLEPFGVAGGLLEGVVAEPGGAGAEDARRGGAG
jgi:hypothetical protein